MPIQAVEPQRLYRRIAEQIARLIKRGEYKPGDRLPPERDLASMLKVSRPSVREALIALEVEGYVDVRVGSGVYVARPGGSRGKAVRLAADSGPFELISARRLLESECAALAAKNASPAQIKRMRAALGAMIRDRKRNVMPLENDRRFHLEMAEAGGNSALALVVRTLWDQRTGPLFLQLEHHFDTPDLWDAAIAEHRGGDGRDRGARRNESPCNDAPAYGRGRAPISEELDRRSSGVTQAIGAGNGAA